MVHVTSDGLEGSNFTVYLGKILVYSVVLKSVTDVFDRQRCFEGEQFALCFGVALYFAPTNCVVARTPSPGSTWRKTHKSSVGFKHSTILTYF